MTTRINSDLQQLTETVTQLSEALAASERRYASMARVIRWSSLVFIILIFTAAYTTSDLIKAYASNGLSWDKAGEEISRQPPTLVNILQSLMDSKELQGTIVKVMQSASMIATQEIPSYLNCAEERSKLSPAEQKNRLCFSKAAVEDLGMFYLDEDNNLLQPPAENASQQEQMAYAKKMMEATLMAAGQSIVDGAALIHRLRRDSDLVRRSVNDIGGVKQLLSGIKDELHLMNGMLISIPAMANEMNVMNQQISVMTHGVGSTMGRMGSMMPW